MSNPSVKLQAQRYLLWIAALLVFLWGCLHPSFRNAEGILAGLFAVPLAVGFALVVLGGIWTGALRIAGLWLALEVVGQAVSLQMIGAGPYLRYQHYKPLGQLASEVHPLLLIYLGVQAVLVIIAVGSRWSYIHAWMKHSFRWWQLLGLAAVFCLTSATVSHEVARYASELLFATFVQTIHLGNIMLVVWAIPEDVLSSIRLRFGKLFGAAESEAVHAPRTLSRFAVLAAIWVLVTSTLLSVFVYERHPHIQDEVIYLLQARYFANGVLMMPTPPVPEACEIFLMQVGIDSWYPVMPPGWPAMLSLGVLVGAPWLVNPLLAALNVLLIHMLLCRLYTARLARMAVFLVCCSPWYVFMAMNFMAHTFTLTCVLAALLWVERARRVSKAGWAALAGVAIGVVSLIRPLDGLVTALFIGLWAIGLGGRRMKMASVTALILGTVAIGSIQFVYTQEITGRPTTFPVASYFDEQFGPKSYAFGFGPERGTGWAIDPYPGHGPIDGLINANLNTFSLNIELFGWSTGSLMLLTLAVFSGSFRRRDTLMLMILASTFGAYFFYYFSGGPDFGARYWYLMFVPCVVLTVRGIESLQEKITFGMKNSPNRLIQIYVAVLVLCVSSVIVYFPWRAIDKYHHYLMMRPEMPQLAKRYNFGNSLVLIRGDEHPDYASVAVYNPLDLWTEKTIYAWDRNPDIRARLLGAYPDRPVWIVNGPTITGRGYEVVEELRPRQPSRTSAGDTFPSAPSRGASKP